VILALVLACKIASPPVATSPAYGATGVPLNAEIKIFSGAGTWTLVDETGATVTTAVTARSSEITVLRPAQLLLPNTRYTFTDGVDVSSPFTTGSHSDETAPSSPGRAGYDYVPATPNLFRGSCGGNLERLEIFWRGISDAETPTGEVMVEALFEPAGGVLALCGLDGACRGAVSMSSASTIKARTIDWAGNVSDFTEPEPIQACGCSSGPSALVLLALALSRPGARRFWQGPPRHEH
jgi:hypothetical protein